MNLSIKNVPEVLAEQLRLRARRNHRSLQGELLSILEQTVSPQRVTLESALHQINGLDFETGDDALDMVREDRDGR